MSLAEDDYFQRADGCVDSYNLSSMIQAAHHCSHTISNVFRSSKRYSDCLVILNDYLASFLSNDMGQDSRQYHPLTV